MLNFFGVLNFKIKRHNKKLIEYAFENLFNKAVKVESRLHVYAFGSILKKDLLFDNLKRLSTEVNRRYNIKNQFIFKFSKSLNTKKKKCLKILRVFAAGNLMDYTNMSVTDAATYVGKNICQE